MSFRGRKRPSLPMGRHVRPNAKIKTFAPDDETEITSVPAAGRATQWVIYVVHDNARRRKDFKHFAKKCAVYTRPLDDIGDSWTNPRTGRVECKPGALKPFIVSGLEKDLSRFLDILNEREMLDGIEPHESIECPIPHYARPCDFGRQFPDRVRRERQKSIGAALRTLDKGRAEAHEKAKKLAVDAPGAPESAAALAESSNYTPYEPAAIGTLMHNLGPQPARGEKTVRVKAEHNWAVKVDVGPQPPAADSERCSSSVDEPIVPADQWKARSVDYGRCGI